MGLLEDVRQLSEQLKKRRAHVRGEEATKQALVLPFLQVLGFDVYDPTEVQPELVADFVKKRQGGPAEKVDYAINLRGELAILVECKAADVALDTHGGQLSRYFNATPTVKLALLTNGVEYRFFTDLQAPNVMDAVPFYRFDVLSFSDREADTLRSFTKEGYNATSVHDLAEELIFTGKVTGLVGDLLRSPSENFVRFLLGEADLVAGRVTARVVDRFTPIVRRAIQSTLVDMMTKSLQHEIATPTEAAPLPIPATPVVAPTVPGATTMSTSGAATSGQVVTTEEELQTFAAVKRICSDSAAGKPISYKDTVSYFGLNLGKVTHWFLRFVIKDDRRYIVARTAPDKAAMMAPGFRVEATSECAGGSRIFYGGLPDLDKLRALIVFAYEEEARRREKGGDEDEDDASP